MPLNLPEMSFAEIAIALQTYGEHQAIALEHMETFCRSGPASQSPGVLRELAANRAAARMAGELFRLFRDLADIEEPIRDLLSSSYELMTPPELLKRRAQG